jgi:CubicO group peptidase (beta-lactamase class C family)
MKLLKVIGKILLWMLAGIAGLALLFFAILAFNTNFSNPDNLEDFVQGKMQKAHIPGISIAFIKDDQVTSTIYAGYADVENQTPVTEETLFQIASVSKTVTGLAIMQLHEKGLIHLDDDINQYLPFEVVHPKFPEEPITFRMLLTHTAGIANNWEVYDSLYTIEAGGGDSPVSLEQFVRGFLTPGGEWYDIDANFTETKPGDSFHYSNPGYALLGYLVEEVTQTDFPVYCKTNIFEPLEMNSTAWLLADTNIANLAMPYTPEQTPLPHYSFATYPDGTLKTTAREYAHLLIAMLNEGSYQGKVLLQPETLEEMLTATADEGNQALTWSYSTLEDIYMGKLQNAKIAGHTGGDPGIFTIALFNRENKTGLVMFMNTEISLNMKILNFYRLVERVVQEAGLNS